MVIDINEWKSRHQGQVDSEDEKFSYTEFARERVKWIDTWDQACPKVQAERHKALISFIEQYDQLERENPDEEDHPTFPELTIRRIQTAGQTDPQVRQMVRKILYPLMGK